MPSRPDNRKTCARWSIRWPPDLAPWRGLPTRYMICVGRRFGAPGFSSSIISTVSCCANTQSRENDVGFENSLQNFSSTLTRSVNSKIRPTKKSQFQQKIYFVYYLSIIKIKISSLKEVHFSRNASIVIL